MKQTDDLKQQASDTQISTSSAKAGWLRTLGAIALLCMPVGASAWYHFSEAKLPVLTLESTRPSLVFSTYLYHHGEQPIEPTSQLKTEFRFRNDGATPVHIERVERSCGCMNPMLSSRDVNPGEIASLMVPISTVNEQPGAKEFLLTVHYTDPKPRKASLTIKAVFPEQMVIVEPKALFLSQRTSSEIPFSVRVSDYRDERQLRVTSVTSTADFVDAVLVQAAAAALVPTPDPIFDEPEFDEPDSEHVQQVSFESPEIGVSDVSVIGESGAVDVADTRTSAKIEGFVAGDLPPGRHHVLVAAETSDPDYPILTIPMMVTGPKYPIGQDVQMTSSVIQLVASEDARARRQGYVTLSAPAEWQFAEPKAWPEQLKVTTKSSPTPIPGKAMTTIQVALTDLPLKQLKEGVVSLATKDGKNLVTVKIVFLWP